MTLKEDSTQDNITEFKRPTLFTAFIPIIFLLILLSLNVYFFGDDTLSGSNQIALILAATVSGIIAVILGYNWEYILNKVVKNITAAMPAIIILLLIGSLAGTWMLSGVVPTMIYYGLKVLNPTIFLFAATFICAMVSLATGSSWSTVATIGVALIGIGKAHGFSEGITAGAIISGAYFGDKISPLSDTTNLAPAMAGTDLFTHIRYMAQTTVPSILITFVIFLVLGFTIHLENSETNVNIVLQAIDSSFNIKPLLFLVPVILIIIIIKKVPPVPALIAGTLLGAVFAVIFQPHIIRQIAEKYNNYAEASYLVVMKSMFGEISIQTKDKSISDLFSTSGMSGMLNTIWLILSAMIFGGAMEAAGFLKRITKPIKKYAKRTGGLVSATVGSCLFFNITASDQYISIVVPGKMFADTYKKRGLKPEVLSRTLEDSGTVTSVLVPWNTCGATQASVLGVVTISYLPYCFFNIISPFMTMFFAFMNIKIRKYQDLKDS